MENLKTKARKKKQIEVRVLSQGQFGGYEFSHLLPREHKVTCVSQTGMIRKMPNYHVLQKLLDPSKERILKNTLLRRH